MNSKNRLVPALVVVAVAFCCGTAMAQFGGDANVWIGMKKFSDDLKLEEEDFLSIDLTQQTEYGLMLNLGKVDWPVAIAVDILRASDDGTDSYSYYYYAAEARVEVTALEVNVGVRKFFIPEGKIQPYIGGGVNWTQAEAELGLKLTSSALPATEKLAQTTLFDESVSDTQSAFGYFLNGGVRGKIGKVLNLGFDLRYSGAEVEFDEIEIVVPSKQAGPSDSGKVEVGGWHAGIFIGARF
jgi:hypothetical protein